MPLLVRLLAGNSVTSITILACLNTADARFIRQLHPAVTAAVAGVPWCDMDIRVVDPVRWRAGLPAAVGARLAGRAAECLLASELAVAALGGITRLDLQYCKGVTDELLLCLPTSLRSLNVHGCEALTPNASFAHLTALTSLNCCETAVVSTRPGGLPPSLQELGISWACGLPADGVLAHLRQLRVLRVNSSRLGIMLASLSPSLEELYATYCNELTPAASFAHLPALCKLDVSHSAIGDATLAALPPSLVFLDAHACYELTPAATLPHLPALELLDVSNTGIGDRLVASLPAALIELRMAGCRRVTAGAALGHVSALRVLHCIDTDLAPAALAACRERGCAVLAASMLRRQARGVRTLALLADGRLASWTNTGHPERLGPPVSGPNPVRLWDVGARACVGVLPGHTGEVAVLTALPDGRLATASEDDTIRLWDTRPAAATRASRAAGAVPLKVVGVLGSVVTALLSLPDGRLACASTRSMYLLDLPPPTASCE